MKEREIIKFCDQEYFTETDLKRYLELKGYNYEKFQEYMRGQTVGIDSDGGMLYYNYDVMRYRG